MTERTKHHLCVADETGASGIVIKLAKEVYYCSVYLRKVVSCLLF